jgi:hypothetical protein
MGRHLTSIDDLKFAGDDVDEYYSEDDEWTASGSLAIFPGFGAAPKVSC